MAKVRHSTGTPLTVLFTDISGSSLMYATRGDASLDYNTAEIFHIRDGLISERWAFSDDTASIVGFFG